MKSTMTGLLAMVFSLGLVVAAACGDTVADPSTTPPIVRPLAM